jgi:hypothetical protein
MMELVVETSTIISGIVGLRGSSRVSLPYIENPIEIPVERMLRGM